MYRNKDCVVCELWPSAVLLAVNESRPFSIPVDEECESQTISPDYFFLLAMNTNNVKIKFCQTETSKYGDWGYGSLLKETTCNASYGAIQKAHSSI